MLLCSRNHESRLILHQFVSSKLSIATLVNMMSIYSVVLYVRYHLMGAIVMQSSLDPSQ